MELKLGSLNHFLGFKGLGPSPEGFSISDIRTLKWNILDGTISLPAAVLDSQKVEHNLDWMENFLTKFENEKTKIWLAPHGKTTMMPSLFQKVCARRSTWGMTLASAIQVQVGHSFGVKKILMANQLVGKRNMEIISEILEKDPSFEFMCIIDSAENVKQLGKYFSERGLEIQVLLEYGSKGGRTGIRDETQETSVLSALEEWSMTVKPVGVEFFEGVIKTEDAIRSHIQYAVSRVKILYESNKFQGKTVVITGAGSAWFDVVAEELSKFSNQNSELPLQIILRPGCYMIHDVGLYTDITNRIDSKQIMTTSLKPTLKIWAYVISVPEKNLAIIGFGKRDGAMDCGFPKAKLHFRPGVFEKPLDIEYGGTWEVFNMMDQHSFLKIEEGDNIEVGDMIAFDIKHPCTTIDKWRNVLVIDDKYSIIDVYQTIF